MIADEGGLPDGVGRLARFQNGSIYWSPATGAWPVYGTGDINTGRIMGKWAATGYERGSLGYPIEDEKPGIDPGSLQQTFQRGTIGWPITFADSPANSNIGTDWDEPSAAEVEANCPTCGDDERIDIEGLAYLTVPQPAPTSSVPDGTGGTLNRTAEAPADSAPIAEPAPDALISCDQLVPDLTAGPDELVLCSPTPEMLKEQGLLDEGGSAQRVAEPETSLSRQECRSLPQRQWGADRGYACMWREDWTFIYNRNSSTPTPGATPVGRFNYIQEHELTTQWNNSAWTGKSAIHFFTGGVNGIATEALMSVSPTCSSSGTGCPVTGSGLSNVPVAFNTDLETTFTVSNGSLAAGAQVTNNTTSKWVFTHPQTNPLKWNAPEARFPQVRCDRAASLTGQGCVIPAAEPIFDISSREVLSHSEHIQRAQLTGLPGAVGGVPLRRLVDPTAIQANRNSSCNRIPGPRDPDTDCDEYPFASTYDGGFSAGTVARTYDDCNVGAGLQGGGGIAVLDPDDLADEGPGISMCFIDRGDNRSGGGYLSWFFRKQRLLDAETFYVN
ncbi:LGFP repeat-containing protein [Rhodococcoides corynebacterioides]|uniref:LGFP repeat-containing protein n=1 Tax=Rhodococcoides corynebacterioides TaxID=53972 RepID=A0ABS7P0Z2_9NOCA|nr:hypothetical protein [Rhodococcus corynebacterioides]MBY6366073.1 hypothetical protein [Rhodococcus corynebacterioides]MBY6406969.1 hypothetical protein [Rhodococcus corynebacterioides]